MFNKVDNPVEWCRLMYELEDARDHISELLKEITEAFDPEDDGDIGVKIGLAHVYSHLNRFWHYRNKTDAELDWDTASEFPVDIHPLHVDIK